MAHNDCLESTTTNQDGCLPETGSSTSYQLLLVATKQLCVVVDVVNTVVVVYASHHAEGLVHPNFVVQKKP
jgi:hypothetical protein